MGAAGTLMGLTAMYGGSLLNILDPYNFQGTAATAMKLLPLIALCCVLYFCLAALFRVREAKTLAGTILRRVAR
jgi:hypothetical protein